MSKSFRSCPAVLAFGAIGLALSSVAQAHVTFASGASFPLPIANTTWQGTVNVPHGCNGLDTASVDVEIPAAFTGTLARHSSYGKAALTKDANSVVTKITWTADAVQSSDIYLHQLSFRGRLPDAPFTKIGFRVVQSCAGGVQEVWEGADLPSVRILPARTPGWNKYTIPAGVSLTSADVKAFFADAQIVWSGLKGYSANAETTAQIGRTSGASALVTATNTDVVLNAGDVIWVRY